MRNLAIVAAVVSVTTLPGRAETIRIESVGVTLLEKADVALIAPLSDSLSVRGPGRNVFAVRAGMAQELEQLVGHYAALGLLGNHEDALDASQEAFVRAYLAFAGFDPEAFRKNREIEERRNGDRFHFIDWARLPATTG